MDKDKYSKCPSCGREGHMWKKPQTKIHFEKFRIAKVKRWKFRCTNCFASWYTPWIEDDDMDRSNIYGQA